MLLYCRKVVPAALRVSLMLIFAVFLAVTVPLLLPTAARAQNKDLVRADEAVTRRVALVIGNTNYEYKPLKNPHNDARDMAAALTKLGYEVTLKYDLTLPQLREVANAWADSLDGHTLALVYYSGHGVTNEGQNYLVPVNNAAITHKRDVPDLAYPFARLLKATKDAGCPLRIFILDACRNDPLPKGLKGDDGQNGLVKVAAPTGAFVAYAAASGETASDNGDGKNGLYTASLLKYIATPGLPIESLFKRVLGDVRRESHDEQHPDVSSQLEGDFSFAGTVTVIPGDGSEVDTRARLVVPVVDSKSGVSINNAIVTVDGQSAAGGQFSLNLLTEADKKVSVTVTAPNYEGKLLEVQLLRGKTVSQPVALDARAAPVPAPAPPPAARNVNPKDGAALVLIPAGPFLMGDDDMSDNKRHTVTLSAYYIYKNLVTVGMYEKFCTATGRKMPNAPDFNANWSKKDHPIVSVSWNDAKAYCDWAGAILPSEAQWEKAARGTAGRKFPWGDTFDTSKLWCSKSLFGGAGGTARVGSFSSGASSYGVLDMAGNVWQWCEDWYDPSEKEKVLRSGSWFYGTAFCFRSAYRGSHAPDGCSDLSGFRCLLPELP